MVSLKEKIDDIISALQKCKQDGWESIEIERGEYTIECYAFKYRPEKDKEYESRMKIEENQKEHHCKTYELLSKEFGKGT